MPCSVPPWTLKGWIERFGDAADARAWFAAFPYLKSVVETPLTAPLRNVSVNGWMSWDVEELCDLGYI